MNQTTDILSISNVCTICQTSYGFSSADRRAIIVLVVLTGIALILCYVGVLWFAIRTRFIPEKKQFIIPETIISNEAYDNDEDIEEHIQSVVNTAAIMQPMTVTIEKEKERY